MSQQSRYVRDERGHAKKIAHYFFFSRRFWVKNPHHSENVYAKKRYTSIVVARVVATTTTVLLVPMTHAHTTASFGATQYGCGPRGRLDAPPAVLLRVGAGLCVRCALVFTFGRRAVPVSLAFFSIELGHFFFAFFLLFFLLQIVCWLVCWLACFPADVFFIVDFFMMNDACSVRSTLFFCQQSSLCMFFQLSS